MRLSIIVAMGKNRVIGRGNALPWHLPEDLRHFKELTLGKPIIMGRKTFDSIGKPLAGRVNIVVTRQSHWYREGVETAAGLEQAVAIARQLAPDGCEEIMVIGGEEIYRQALPSAERLYLTRVDLDVEGDAFFPEMADRDWRLVSSEKFHSAKGRVGYWFETLDRQTAL